MKSAAHHAAACHSSAIPTVYTDHSAGLSEDEMKQALVVLFALAVGGALAADVAAQQPRTGQTTRGVQTSRVGDTRQRPDNQNCGQLGQLRHELARLQQELRHLQAALAEARKNGNRERAEQIAHEIRQVHAQIQDVQQKIRRLQQECRGR